MIVNCAAIKDPRRLTNREHSDLHRRDRGTGPAPVNHRLRQRTYHVRVRHDQLKTYPKLKTGILGEVCNRAAASLVPPCSLAEYTPHTKLSPAVHLRGRAHGVNGLAQDTRRLRPTSQNQTS